MKSKIVIMILGGLVIGLTGCANGPHTGIVGWNKGFSSGSFAPDIPFTSAEGKEIRLNEIREPVTILAFTSPPSRNCCSLRPELVELAKRFRHLPITVIQISLPTNECPHGAGCTKSCDVIDENLILLCDPARIAWKAYNQPNLDTVILVDEDNKVVDIQPISNLKVLADKAEKMGDQIDWENFDVGD